METPRDKTIFSGIQPSGVLHLGNYLGALKPWVALQEQNKTYFCVVDLHAITVPYQADKLREHVLATAALYLAAGLDPKKSTVFVQSAVPAHTELAWLLATQTPFGELGRMTQFKDKSAKQAAETTLGLFAYPALMAADILLYQTMVVPVGADQQQHLELTRDIAKRFNHKFGDTFTIPQAFFNKKVARIMSLSDPQRKMSKSDGEKSYIALTDEPDLIKRKVMSAVTETEARLTADTPSLNNLLSVYHGISGEEVETIIARYAERGFKEFKEDLAELIIEELSPLQKRYREIRADEDSLRDMLAAGAKKAALTAEKTLIDVKDKMGIV